MPHFPSRFTFLLGMTTTCLAYTWPSPQYDALEGMLYEGRKSDGSSLAAIVNPCKTRTDTGASIAAEWLRFAFHDMATYNAANGTGGVDGSIAYELDREENFGVGFTHTLSDFETYPNKYVSRSDIIALGAIFAVSTCGGPIISFNGGRIDAWQAGPSGVPEPQQDLPTTTAMFARAGFNGTDMIKLVACGHTLGGVRSTDFPQLVAPAPNSVVPVFKNFDTTPQYDDTVVTQYLDGSTQNPLVVGSNATMMSDLRVFSSDGNVTMQSLSTPQSYASECQAILLRMINVVPQTVDLTSTVTLLPAKVHDVQLTFERGNFVFKASFRLLRQLNTTATNDTVNILWCDRYGQNANCIGNTRSSIPVTTVVEDPDLCPVTNAMGYSFNNYNFVVPVNSTQSISKFWFEVNGKTVYNNGGGGYVVEQDQLLFVPTLSQSTLQPGANASAPWVNDFFIVAAVRDGSNPSRVYMNAIDLAISGFPAPFNTTVDLQLNTSITPIQGYSFYTGSVTDGGFQLTLDIYSIAANGSVYVEDFKPTTFLSNTPYNAPSTVTNTAKVSSSGSWRLGAKLSAYIYASVATGILVVL